MRSTKVSELTSESPVDRLDSVEKPHSSFTAESCRSLLSLRSSSLRWEGFDLRAEAREEQLISDSLQLSNLDK